MARRSSEVELCFDSMSDLITNLAGGLILVVLLLLGVTREAGEMTRSSAGAADPKAASQSPRKLVERLNVLQADLARVNGDIDEYEAELEELDKKTTELIGRAKSSPSGARVKPEKKGDNP